jgi:hypothetical protein
MLNFSSFRLLDGGRRHYFSSFSLYTSSLWLLVPPSYGNPQTGADFMGYSTRTRTRTGMSMSMGLPSLPDPTHVETVEDDEEEEEEV